jgi:hypothetical protein
MFLTGFIFGSIVVYLVCLQEALLPPYGNAGERKSPRLITPASTANSLTLQYKHTPSPPLRENNKKKHGV